MAGFLGRFRVKTSLFPYHFEMLPPLQYDEVFLISLLGGCYHDLVFVDPVNGYSKLKLFVRVNFIKK